MRLIVTAMKNEGPFILEWAAFHLSIGFDGFLVYTNDCEDGTDAIWTRLSEMGFGAHEVNDQIKARGVQKTALMRADDHPLTKQAEWLSCLDCDEFLNIKTGEGALDDLLGGAPDADLHMIAWRRFGASGVAAFRDAPVTEQFTHAAPEVCPYPFHNYGAKSVWRANGPFERIGVHRPLEPTGDVSVVNGEAQALAGYEEKRLWLTPNNAGYAGAQVNHYSLRSAQSYLVKCARGLPNSKITDLDLGYWAERNFNQVEDTSIARRLPAMKEKLAELKSDPVLADLHDEAVQWHRGKIRTLLSEREPLKLFLRIITTETSVLSGLGARQLNPLIARSWEMDRAHRKGAKREKDR
ncbi:MAG: glycosyltransferase family 2 protein [Pseudomonadota bacterium]